MDSDALQAQVQGNLQYAAPSYDWDGVAIHLADASDSDLSPEVRVEQGDGRLQQLIGSSADPAFASRDMQVGRDFLTAPDGRKLDVVDFYRPPGGIHVVITVELPQTR